MHNQRLAYLVAASMLWSLACGGAQSGSGNQGGGGGSGGGGGGGDGGTTYLSDAAPLLAIVSPVANKAGVSIQKLASHSMAISGTPTQPLSLPDQIAAIKDRLTRTTVEDCLAGISFNFGGGGNVECYGPTLGFLHHPNGQQSSSGTGGCAVVSNDGSCLPSGDLGIWESTESSGEACTAAKMNAQVMSVSGTVNTAVTLMAGLICVAQVNGETLAAGGDAVDLADVLTENLNGAAFTTASLARLADRGDGSASYQLQLVGTINQREVSVTMIHSPGDDDGNGAAGLMNGIDKPTQQDIQHAFSVLYQVTDGKLHYELRSGNAEASIPEDQLFDDDGTFSFANQIARGPSGGAGGGDYELAEIDGTTGLGALIHAWQAGSGDPFTRVFHAATQADGNGGEDTGFGYFGFGPPLDNAELGVMAGMFCNWAGPGNVGKQWQGDDTVLNTPKVQGQTMERDSTSGYFVPVDDYITYAPTNSCDTVATSDFVYLAGNPTTADLEALTAQDVTNDLVAYGTIGTMPEITPPAAYP